MGCVPGLVLLCRPEQLQMANAEQIVEWQSVRDDPALEALDWSGGVAQQGFVDIRGDFHGFEDDAA